MVAPRTTQARRPPGSGSTVLLVAVALGVLVLVALAALVLSGGDEAAPGSPSASDSASPGAATSVPSAALPSASGSPAATRGAAPEAVTPGTVAVVEADMLRIREAPTTGAPEVGTLAAGTRGFVVEGPTDADGYRWYLVTAMGIPPQSGCAGPLETSPYSCPVWYGWLASASPEGDAWLRPAQVACPEPGPLDRRWLDAQLEPMSLLACFGADPVTVTAWLPERPDSTPPPGGCRFEPGAEWLCDVGYTTLMPDAAEPATTLGFSIAVPPDGVDEFEAMRGQWVQVTGHFDDPAAQGCPEGHERQRCRARFVFESAVPTAAP